MAKKQFKFNGAKRQVQREVKATITLAALSPFDETVQSLNTAAGIVTKTHSHHSKGTTNQTRAHSFLKHSVVTKHSKLHLCFNCIQHLKPDRNTNYESDQLKRKDLFTRGKHA